MTLNALSPSEIYVLNIIYELGEAEIYDILKRIASEKQWTYTTVLTLATRMTDKGHLTKIKSGKRFVFTPSFTRFESFAMVMDRFFGTTVLDDPRPLIQYLLKSKKIRVPDKKLLRELSVLK